MTHPPLPPPSPDHNSLPFAITMGDPAGIGPEIIAKLAQVPRRPPVPYVVIGNPAALQKAVHAVGARCVVQPISDCSDRFDGLAEALAQGAIPVLPAGPPLPHDLAPGQVDARAGAAAHAYVQRAIDLALAGRVRGIVTAPIHKLALRAAGITHPGHTEILAARTGTRDFAMMLTNPELRVVLVSIHVALSDAIAAVTPDNELRAIRLAHAACRGLGLTHPRVAVAGLNPHAGENGLFGDQDQQVIAPAIAAARAEGIDASGPWPGDTVFMRARRGDFDVVVAQYHDQGLIPVKYLGVEQGVNITLGLPFIRTSVDHGTAFDIAGTGRASASSLVQALQYAAAMGATTSTAATTSAQAPMPELHRRPPTTARRPHPDFIFMLTRQDRTVANAVDLLPEVLAAGMQHIGFKDVGLPLPGLRQLVAMLKHAVPQWQDQLRAALQRAVHRLPRAEVDGVAWYWPAGEDPCSRRWKAPEGVRLLAPFDPVVWDRDRFERLWGWAYRFEAYTPAPKRVRGYYALPLLWRGQVIGWGNLAVQDGVLQADLGHVSGRAPRDAAYRRALEEELQRLREFLGSD